MRAQEFITENSPAWDFRQQHAKMVRGEMTDEEAERYSYAMGKCAQLAIALHRLDPKRFDLGLMVEYFINVPDITPDDDEWDELTPAQQQAIANNPRQWVMGHAFVRDNQTGEFVDARGRFPTQQGIQTAYQGHPARSRVLFPTDLRTLASVGQVEMTDTGVRMVRGSEYLERFATDSDMKQAQNFAQKYLGIGGTTAVNESTDADQVLQYVKQAHAPEPFDIDSAITDHPRWELTNIPVSQLKLDPDGEAQDPYGRVNWVDYDKVQDLMPKISAVLKRMPIVVDSQGWIIDGNHRAMAAAESGLKTVPAYVPASLTEAFDQPYKLKWEKGEHGDYDALAKLDDGTNLSIMFNLGDQIEDRWMVEFYRNNSQALTGEGDAQRVFATVLTAVGQFIRKRKPQSLFFSAVQEDDPPGSRTRLYDRLVQRYASNLGYTLQKQEYPEQMAYELTRNQMQENFADGRNPQDKGDSKRYGVPTKASVSTLRKVAKQGGRKGQLAHWMANMKAGRARAKRNK
jgi:hypothetical protein